MADNWEQQLEPSTVGYRTAGKLEHTGWSGSEWSVVAWAEEHIHKMELELRVVVVDSCKTSAEVGP